jgi:GNAT superfamily N-acetyltransferase
VRLYKNEPHWIRPLDKDINDVFDPKKNKTFRHGSLIRWILVDAHNTTIGRVAAFVNEKTMKRDNDQPTGGLGFFECIHNQEAAFMLFDASKQWLQEKGMEAMDGPINFGNRDKWWGLLIDGFDKDPNYSCNYHFPYYKEFFEAYGFQVYFNQFTYARKVMDPLSIKIKEKAERIFSDPDYSFIHLKKSELDKFTRDFRDIYNKAWSGHKGVPQLTEAQAKASMKQLKPVMDEKILWFGYYKGEPVAFFIMLPELNQIFKYVNGKLDFIGKLKFVWHQWRKTCKKMYGVVFGVVPEHQGKGVEGAIIMAARKMVQEDYYRYEDFEMNWIGDFNPKMIRVVEQVGGDVAKTHVTYRKLFDETKPFKRCPII